MDDDYLKELDTEWAESWRIDSEQVVDGRDFSYSALGIAGLVGIITLFFIVFKTAGITNWSWAWVLSPLWISAAISIGLTLLTGCLIVILETRPRNGK
jgi:hypothetical protein